MSKPTQSYDESNIPKASFHDDRLSLDHWFPKLAASAEQINLPETKIFTLNTDVDGVPGFDSDAIAQHIADDLGGEAFVRSGFKSAQMHMLEGSLVYEPTVQAVERTIGELLSQHAMMSMRHGGIVAVRELLDVNWVHYTREDLHPEVRVFVRNGDVVCHHPRLEGFERPPGGEEFRDHAESYIESAWDDELREQAAAAAEALDGWWSVDWVMDVNGDWWCTDAALDAAYWRNDQECWQGLSSHPGDCEHAVDKHVETLEPPSETEGWR